MNDILQYRPVTLDDQPLLKERLALFRGKNCDLNFMNIFSWRFLYKTEIAQWKDHLIFRFKADGHVAHMGIFTPVDLEEILDMLVSEAERDGYPFLLMGLDEDLIPDIEKAKPDYFIYEYDRDYCDYIYSRESLETLAGKKLHPKRNFFNRFRKAYPDYLYRELKEEDFDACLALDNRWIQHEDLNNLQSDENERTSMYRVFDNWNRLGGTGGAIFVGSELVAFTYGAPVNDYVFDVCVEKANPEYEGSYATINKEFVAHLPLQYTLINREEDLGIDGLRKAKLSYHPEILLKKYVVMAKHHFKDGKVR